MLEIERRNPLLARVASGRESYYKPTPQVNLNPNAVQFVQGIPTQVGNFFGRNTASNNAWQYQNPQYQRVPMAYGTQARVVPAAQQQANLFLNENVKPIIDEYVTPQLIQNALLLGATGTTAGGLLKSSALPMTVMATAPLGRLAVPAFNAAKSIANSPVGRWGAKVIDFIF